MIEDSTLYNQVTVKNVDNEDFDFKVNLEGYTIGAGEVRMFPKFMVRPMLKHLIDKILIKRDPEGKLLRNQKLRDELAEQIILNEESYERPKAPTDKDIVEKMNKPELDRILERNKARFKDETLIPSPKAALNKLRNAEKVNEPKIPENKPAAKKGVVPSKAPVVDPEQTEKFDQIEEEKAEDSEIPSRESMIAYAKNTLKLDPEEPATKKAWDALSDEQLYEELGLNAPE